MHRRRKHGLGFAACDKLAFQHHRYIVGNSVDRNEVLVDEKIGDAQLVLKPFQQAKDFLVDQLVER